MKKGIVRIVKNSFGALVTPFYNSEYGFITLSTDRLVNGQLETVNCRVKQTIENLEIFIQQKFSDGVMNGTILIQEYLESEVPDLIKKGYYGNRAYEKAVLEYLKINPLTGLPVIVQGQRVLRFAWPIEFDNIGTVTSLLVEYNALN